MAVTLILFHINHVSKDYYTTCEYKHKLGTRKLQVLISAPKSGNEKLRRFIPSLHVAVFFLNIVIKKMNTFF